MKKIVLFLISFVIISSMVAQEIEEVPEMEKPRKPEKSKMLLFELVNDIWQSEQAGISFKGLNRGANIYSMREKTLGNGNFGIALGIGVGTHNLYSDGLITNELDTAYMSTGNVIFSKIPDNIDYKVNKFTVAYFDIPIEIRFHPVGKFNMAVGFKTGLLLNSHTKYSGDDLAGGDQKIKFKYYKINNVETLRYGVTGRIGYKFIGLTFYYSLSDVFEKNKGPELYPISVGLAFTPF